MIKPWLLPEKWEDNQIRNRRKFLPSDDKFLLQGLKEYGYRDMAKIQKFWLPDKSESEIKHRYKNLTWAKAEPNIIKEWKSNHKNPLTPAEKEKLKMAYDWFGDTHRWPVITKCFFPDKSQQFLKKCNIQESKSKPETN